MKKSIVWLLLLSWRLTACSPEKAGTETLLEIAAENEFIPEETADEPAARNSQI